MSEFFFNLMMLMTHRPTKELSFFERTRPMVTRLYIREHFFQLFAGYFQLELIWEYGYPAEVHAVVTEDSYVNAVFRIPGSKQSPPSPNKPVVYMQHDIFMSSADFVVAGRGRAPALLLADAGYDVWLGNARGNRFSRDHKYLAVSKKQYWDFSWHQIGLYDLPAAIDYILAMTSQTKLHYIGFSEGTTAFFVMASERLEYNHKIKTMQALSPVAFLQKISSFNRFWLQYATQSRPTLTITGKYEFYPYSREFSRVLAKLSSNGSLLQSPIVMSFSKINGGNSGQIERRELSTFLSHLPGGASTGRVAHYGQLAGTPHFRRFDFGTKKNIAIYGHIIPPDYHLENITVPMFLHFSAQDGLNNEAVSVPETTTNHLIFIISPS
jgi:lysosomal acid lipase/cholesteryl ester hydrolase